MLTRILNKNHILKFQNIKRFQQIRRATHQIKSTTKSDWENALPFEKLPGPSRFNLFIQFLPGGKYYNLTLTEIYKKFREDFGDLFKIPGILGKRTIVFAFDPDDFEKVFRTEGPWPLRRGLDTFEYYRIKHRPDFFQGIGGLASDQGEAWAKTRTIVNPILMNPKTVKYYIPKIDEIATEFINLRMKPLLDNNNELPANWSYEINKWSLESIGYIALDTRLGLLTDGENTDDGLVVIQSTRKFFELHFELDILPSLWHYVKTPKFRKLMKVFDDLNRIIMKKVDEAVERIKLQSTEGDSILEKLLKVDRKTAILMAYDMLLAGVDTTSSATISVLYCLSKNPDKQAKLRKELMTIMPEKDTPLTLDNMRNLPYLRACIKEAFRFNTPVAVNFRATGKDIVLKGYQIPKETDVSMVTSVLFSEDIHFPDSKNYQPERWLKDSDKREGCPSAKTAHPFIYLPFGFGPRMCVGKRFAEMEMEILLSRIIRNFYIEWHHPDLKFISKTITFPSGELKFCVKDVEN